MTDKFTFEAAMKRLEAIVGALEKGDAPLDKSLALFEEGTTLIRKCGLALDRADQQLKQLIRTESGPQVADFEEEPV